VPRSAGIRRPATHEPEVREAPPDQHARAQQGERYHRTGASSQPPTLRSATVGALPVVGEELKDGLGSAFAGSVPFARLVSHESCDFCR